jgi:outer membrane protein
MMKRWFVVGVCALLCCACAAAGSTRAAEKMTVTLKGAIDTALKANIALREAANLTESQEISLATTRNDFLPNVGFSAGTSRSYSKQYSDVTESFEGTYSGSTSFSLSSGLELFSGFKRSANLRQAQLQLEAKRSTYARSREDVVFETAQQFLLVVAEQDLIKVYEENLESQRRQLDQIDAYCRSGKRPVVDLYQQQASVAEAESNLLGARRDYDVGKLELLQIMAVDPGVECDVVAPDIEAMIAAISSFLEGDPTKEALSSRTDLIAQRLQMEAAKKQITASRSGYWPSLSLSAGMGTSYRGSETYDFSDQLDNNMNASVGLSLSFAVFDRMATRNSVAQAKIGLRQEQLGTEKLELQVKIEVQQALRDHETVQKAVEVAQAQSRYSEQALKSMEERYKVNASTFVELMETRASALQSSYNLIKARYDLLVKGIAVLYYSGTIEKTMPFLD